MNRHLRKVLLITAIMTTFSTQVQSETIWLDLTHPVPTYKPQKDDPTLTDLNQPWLDSKDKEHPTWYQHAILTLNIFEVDIGYYPSGRLIIDEHHGTHLDAINHIINSKETMIEGGIPNDKREDTSQLGTEDLIGPIVLIDIGPRVRKELAKNGGVPSPNKSVTDFSDTSEAVVTAADIDSIADQLEDGAWIVTNLDWAQFYFSGDPTIRSSPYFNNFNHPGYNKAAIDRLAEIIDKRGLKLGGIATDNITIDTGQGAFGDGAYPMRTNPWYSHTVLMQRGVLFVENLAYVDKLANVINDGATCTLIIGAPKHIRGTGGPSRVFAMCET